MKKLKILALAMSVAMLGSVFTACGNNQNDSTGKNPSTDKVIKIGVLQFGEFDALQQAYKGFVDGLKEAGYVDGQNIKINLQSAAADVNNCPSIADTLINEGSDLILAIATPSILALKEKTTDIPLLFTAVTDPVDSKIVASKDAPGGNITGTSDLNPIDQQIELALKIVPNAKKIGVLYTSSESNSAAQYEAAKKKIESCGLTCVKKTIASIDEAKTAVESLSGQIDALYIPTDNTIAESMTIVAEAAKNIKVPIIAGEKGMVKDGALATIGISYYELGKQTAQQAVQILKGEKKPGEIPVGYQSEELLETAVNTDTASALGIALPEDVSEGAVKYPQ